MLSTKKPIGIMPEALPKCVRRVMDEQADKLKRLEGVVAETERVLDEAAVKDLLSDLDS